MKLLGFVEMENGQSRKKTSLSWEIDDTQKGRCFDMQTYKSVIVFMDTCVTLDYINMWSHVYILSQQHTYQVSYLDTHVRVSRVIFFHSVTEV